MASREVAAAGGDAGGDMTGPTGAVLAYNTWLKTILGLGIAARGLTKEDSLFWGATTGGGIRHLGPAETLARVHIFAGGIGGVIRIGAMAEGGVARIGALAEGVDVTKVDFLEGILSALLTRTGM